MATYTYKVLGQSAPSAATLTTLYTVPSLTSTVVSSLSVCNQSATPTSYRIAIRIAGAGATAAQYIAYDFPIFANEPHEYTAGWTLATTDVISVYATLATLSFVLAGQEIA